MALRSRNKRLADFSMSSLTDIIFLLLIFFLLTSTLVAPNAIPMILPSSDPRVQATQTASVNIDEGLNYYVNGKRTNVEQLEQMIRIAMAGKEDEGLILYADKSVPIENVVEVLNIANNMKIKVVLATQPKK